MITEVIVLSQDVVFDSSSCDCPDPYTGADDCTCEDF